MPFLLFPADLADQRRK